jgi:uncharacterized Zn-binding protein involved in type VI secretion
MDMSEQEQKGKTYCYATVGALTERGGRVTTGSMVSIGGLAVARVGDVVTYAGGSEAVIADGAGAARVIGNRPAALVGSSLSNGDRIIETLWQGLGMTLFVPDGKVIPGLFDADWTPPPRGPDYRFVVPGSTTARGGVLTQATSDWEVPGTYRSAARIGDCVEYQDGSRARVVTGVGMRGNEQLAFAVVGSMLENGDVITDSPHRTPCLSTEFVRVGEHGAAIARQ